jgi:hypothetical protein
MKKETTSASKTQTRGSDRRRKQEAQQNQTAAERVQPPFGAYVNSLVPTTKLLYGGSDDCSSAIAVIHTLALVGQLDGAFRPSARPAAVNVRFQILRIHTFDPKPTVAVLPCAEVAESDLSEVQEASRMRRR